MNMAARVLERKGGTGVMRKEWHLELCVQETFFKAMPFTLAINMSNALFYTRLVLEEHEKVATLESKDCLWLASRKYCIEGRTLCQINGGRES